MSVSNIKKMIKDKLSGSFVPDFLLYEEVTSTNDILKEIAEGKYKDDKYNFSFDKENVSEGFSVIALSQVKGKGRSGRKFFSPPSCSVYLSILLRPDLNIEDSLLITPMAAAAVHDAILDVCKIDAGIKWVNDLYIDNKKICGILTEGSLKNGSDKLEYAIVGIGLNIFYPKVEIPDDLKDIYGTIFDQNVEYDESIIANLASEIMKNTLKYYNEISDRTFIDSYKKSMFLTGQKVTYVSGDEEHLVVVNGVDENARLIVTDENGEIHTLKDGEVRVKMLRN